MGRGERVWELPLGAADISYDEMVRAWARVIIADQAPAEDGFVPAPIFPVRPASEPASAQPRPRASV